MQAVCEKINGIDTNGLRKMIDEVATDAPRADVRLQAVSRWRGGTRSETSVDGYELGGKSIGRGFKIVIDEPVQLLGKGDAPNPQEVLMAAVNACMMVGFVAQCAMRGITLESLEFHTDGKLDLRGFLGIDSSIPPGYERMHSTIRVRGDGTPAQFREVLDAVLATSPNYYNITRPITFNPKLEVK